MILLFGGKPTNRTGNQYLSCKKTIRIISNQKSRSNFLPLFKDLYLLGLSDFFKFKLLTFVYESTELQTPFFSHGYFSFNSAIHNYSTKQSYRGDLYLMGKNTLRYGLGSIRYMGAQLWNELPREIRNSSSKVLFKKKFKKAPSYQNVDLLCFVF